MWLLSKPETLGHDRTGSLRQLKTSPSPIRTISLNTALSLRSTKSRSFPFSFSYHRISVRNKYLFQDKRGANLRYWSARKSVEHTEWHRLGEAGIPYATKPITAQWVVEKLDCVSIDILLGSISRRDCTR